MFVGVKPLGPQSSFVGVHSPNSSSSVSSNVPESEPFAQYHPSSLAFFPLFPLMLFLNGASWNEQPREGLLACSMTRQTTRLTRGTHSDSARVEELNVGM